MRKNQFWHCVWKYSGLFFGALLLTYILSSIVVEGNRIISDAIDTMLSGEAITLYSFLPLFLGLTILGVIAAFTKSALISHFSIRVQTAYKELVAKKLYRLEYKYFDQNGSASVINKMNSDIAEADTLLGETLPSLCSNAVELVVYAVYVGQMSKKLLLLMLVCYPVVLLFTNYVARKLTDLKKTYREKADSMTEIAQDCTSGILVLRAFGAERLFEEKMKSAAMELVENEGRRTRISNTVIIIRRVLQWIPNIACAVYAYVLVKNGALSVGSLMAFIIILDRFVIAFIGLPFGIVDAKEQLVCVKRVEKILNESEETGGSEAEGIDKESAVAFRNVAFSYSEGKSVLQSVDFTITSGKKVAFVGDSGGGKSTIFHILCGFYPVTAGNYQLFGREFKEWDIEAAREQMALVSQNVFLFPTSIYENVRYGNQNAGKKEIEEACRNAGIHEFIMSLPEQYDTIVGERGVLLSGGEKQRVSIARAFLKNAPILLLDEPTSAVDVATEKVIQKAIDKLSENKTCITIAHRLSTIQNADEIMVLKDGIIVERGKHRELLAAGGVYAGMYGKEAEVSV